VGGDRAPSGLRAPISKRRTPTPMPNASSSATAWASPSTATAPATCSRSPTCCCCAAISVARAPASAAARPFQRAGRSHRRHHRKAQRRACSTASSPTFGFEPPRAHGHDAVEAIKAIRDGRSKVLICLGGNLAVAMSDPEATFEAMRKLDLAVHIAPSSTARICSWRAIDHPAVPGPHRNRHAGWRAAVGDGRRFDVDGARLARRLKPASEHAALGACHHRNDGDGHTCRTPESTGRQ
jgi:hypothetical protein